MYWKVDIFGSSLSDHEGVDVTFVISSPQTVLASTNNERRSLKNVREQNHIPTNFWKDQEQPVHRKHDNLMSIK